MKVISETLGHSRHSFTADTYTSVLPEVSRAAAEAVAAVVPRMSADEVTAEPPVPTAPPNVVSLVGPAQEANRTRRVVVPLIHFGALTWAR